MIDLDMSSQTKWFAIKADIRDLTATSFAFAAHKTMYDGKHVAVGDRIFLFASETSGGSGLFARGIVSRAEAVPRSGAARQTPRVSILVERNGTSTQPLGRTQLRAFRGIADGSPEAELDFKLYRQATDKIVGLTDSTGEFLDALFGR